MTEDLSVFSDPKVRNSVQDLRELLSQNRVAFLLGAGCSKNAGLPLMPELTVEVMKHPELSAGTRDLLESLGGIYSGAERPTIEDYMSDIVDFSSVAQRRLSRGADDPSILIGEHQLTSPNLSRSLDEIKARIVGVIDGRDIDLSNHRSFVRSIHVSLQAGKSARTVDYFVLNYDTLFEDALGIEKVRYADGFAGAVTAWWEPSVFKEDALLARVHKIHGSIEWFLVEGDSLPRRIRKGIKINGEQSPVLIYPAAPKFQEIQRDPFAQLLQRMRGALRPSNRQDVVLAICGYGFQDSHVNIEIKNALIESQEGLTAVVFTRDIEPGGILSDWLKNPVLSRQLRIYTNRGLTHTEAPFEIEQDLPWWKFEVLARLLGGER